MRSTNWRAPVRNYGKEARAFPVFRFRRKTAPVTTDDSSPFTEVPVELRRGFVFSKVIHKVFNFLFLLILGISLLGLVLAFAYQMIYHPNVLQAQAASVVTAVQSFIQALAGAAK